MLSTRFTELVGCSIPRQQSPMGGVTTIDLVAAVANAGGMGMPPAQLIPPAVLRGMIAELREKTEGAFGVTFLMPFFDSHCLEIAAEGARLVDFFYADPDPALVERVHAAGALASWQAGSVEEAVAARDAGCDLLVVQGAEAGGRIRGRIGLLPLLSAVLDAVDIPVLAAGGIGSPRSMAAVLAAGAAGVRVGTRFLAASESGAHPEYVQALIAARPEDTLITDAFSVMWPNGPEPHRVLRSCIERAEEFEGDSTGTIEMGGRTIEVPRFGVPCPNTATSGSIEAMALYAGQSVGAVERVQPAAEIVEELAKGAERLLTSPY